MDFYRLFTSISELRPTWGAFVWLIFAIVMIISVLKQGKGGAVIQLQAVFMALILTKSLPLDYLHLGEIKLDYIWLRLIFFLIAFALISFFLAKTSFSLIRKSHSTLLNTIVLSFVFAGFFVSAIIEFLPDKIKEGLGEWVNLVFTGGLADFLWMLASVIFILLIG